MGKVIYLAGMLLAGPAALVAAGAGAAVAASPEVRVAAAPRAFRVNMMLGMMEAQLAIRPEQQAAWDRFADALKTVLAEPGLRPADGGAAAGASPPEPFTFAYRLADAAGDRDAAAALTAAADGLVALLDAGQLARQQELEAELLRRAAERREAG